jgi:hypothetical protein
MLAALPMRKTMTRFGPLQITISVLVAATALTHLYLGAITSIMVATMPALTASLGGPAALNFMAALFYLNCTGYVALNVALYLPALRRFQRIVRWALIGYAALTFVVYFPLAAGHYDAMGFADKAVELLIIGLLLTEGRRAR